MKLLALVLCCVQLAKVVVGQTPEATFSCAADTKTIQITVPNSNDPGSGAITYAEAVVAGQPIGAPCSSTTADNAGNFVLTIKDTECGTAVAGDVLEVTVNLVQTHGLIQSIDWFFVISCDFSVAQTVQTSQAQGVSVSDTVPTGTGDATQAGEAVTLTVTDNNDGDTTSCALGDTIKLKLDLATSNTAKGLYGIMCEVYPDAAAIVAGTPKLGLIENNCAVASFAGALAATTGFGNGVTGNDNTAANFISYTNGFQCFRFSTLNTLVIKCSIGFCTDGTEDKCDTDNCAWITSNTPTRRRRSVNNSTFAEKSLDVTINVGASTQEQIKDKVIKPVDNDSVCGTFGNNNIIFIVAVIIMAVLLLVSLSATVYLAMRTKRAQDHMDMKGITNPAF